MLVDIVTIFPEYFEPLKLSLVGKAIEAGRFRVRVHNLRGWTHDRHNTVDDSPYGGGAGMVMKPEPWGEAFDAILASGTTDTADARYAFNFEEMFDSTGGTADTGVPSTRPVPPTPTLVIPTPAGKPFTQRVARELAATDWLLFACGRYEGIDQRVIDYARTQMPVAEISLGDYVLNGGEVAALAMIEATVRLLPGVLGNPESLAEESHADDLGGLLEYPVYTKPASWRGLEVPPVLLSGHHKQIAAWRTEQSLARTRAIRPDLLPELDD